MRIGSIFKIKEQILAFVSLLKTDKRLDCCLFVYSDNLISTVLDFASKYGLKKSVINSFKPGYISAFPHLLNKTLVNSLHCISPSMIHEVRSRSLAFRAQSRWSQRSGNAPRCMPVVLNGA